MSKLILDHESIAPWIVWILPLHYENRFLKDFRVFVVRKEERTKINDNLNFGFEVFVSKSGHFVTGILFQ